MENVAPCRYCGAAELRACPAFAALARVTSDCRPWPAGGRIGACARCGGIQKPVDDAYRAELAAIYAAYAMYAQGGGSEQRAFDPATGSLDPRSVTIVSEFLAGTPLAQRGRWLDVGCGNGATLRAVAQRLPQWHLVGSELDDRNRAAVEAIAGVERLHCGDLQGLDGPFDVISMVHVYEHVEDPVAFLASLRRLLAPGGMVAVESPLAAGNYFDLAIADHVLHFDRAALAWCARRSGFEIDRFEPRFMGREFFATVVASQPASDAVPEPSPAYLDARIAWLSDVADAARARAPVAIFGSSIGATFAFAACGGAVTFFVDEDPNRIGRTHLGVPIVSPDRVDPREPVFVPLPPQLAAAVRSKPGREAWIAPPPYPRVPA